MIASARAIARARVTHADEGLVIHEAKFSRRRQSGLQGGKLEQGQAECAISGLPGYPVINLP